MWAGEWNNETSSGGGRELGYLLECDPTILGIEGEGDPICGWINRLEAVRADWESRDLSGSVARRIR